MIQLVRSRGGDWGGENGPLVLSRIVKGSQRREKELLFLLLSAPPFRGHHSGSSRPITPASFFDPR